MTNKKMSLEVINDSDWLERQFRKSESNRTKHVASVSIKMFELFCKDQGVTKQEMIEEYQNLFKQSDIRSICLSLDNFIQFLNEDRSDITLNAENAPIVFKKKNPKTIKTYFGFVKSYLRVCHGIKISIDDVKDYVIFPKQRKEPRKAISIETLKQIFNSASPQRRALYYVLISSGMRISEALRLTKSNFHLNEDPIRITLHAEDTKQKEGRETYISSEAYDKLKPILDKKQDDELVFSNGGKLHNSVVVEECIFARLRVKLNLLEKYHNSPRYVTNIHSFRAYFHTKASQKHGSEYANALDGHGAYLKQYYRLSDEDRGKKYKELESDLLIESRRPKEEKSKDETIEKLQKEMEKMQEAMFRAKIINESDKMIIQNDR